MTANVLDILVDVVIFTEAFNKEGGQESWEYPESQGDLLLMFLFLEEVVEMLLELPDLGVLAYCEKSQFQTLTIHYTLNQVISIKVEIFLETVST